MKSLYVSQMKRDQLTNYSQYIAINEANDEELSHDQDPLVQTAAQAPTEIDLCTSKSAPHKHCKNCELQYEKTQPRRYEAFCTCIVTVGIVIVVVTIVRAFAGSGGNAQEQSQTRYSSRYSAINGTKW